MAARRVAFFCEGNNLYAHRSKTNKVMKEKMNHRVHRVERVHRVTNTSVLSVFSVSKNSQYFIDFTEARIFIMARACV